MVENGKAGNPDSVTYLLDTPGTPGASASAIRLFCGWRIEHDDVVMLCDVLCYCETKNTVDLSVHTGFEPP